MKTRILLFLTALLILCSVESNAQVPQGYNYQAVLRDISGNLITDESITAKFMIMAGNPSGDLVWEEDHTTATNGFGMFNVILGRGTRIDGSALVFSEIDWTVSNYYLKVNIFYSGAWHNFESNELVSVPYAVAAQQSLDNPFVIQDNSISLLDKNLNIGSVEEGTSRVSIISTDDNSEDALFEVRRQDGQPVFSVYSDGVHVNIPNDSQLKGARGGFSVGGFDRSKGIPDQFMVITPDSTRFYFDDNSNKGARGGFAVGGFDRSKSYRQDYLNITSDSTRVYVENPAKGSRGGFSVGGFDRSKGAGVNFFDITPDNYFIGHRSGQSNTDGMYNSFVGYETGPDNTTGGSNALFGFQAGYNNKSGSGNLFLGYQSGYSNTDGLYNTFMGYTAGFNNSTGGSNTFLGSFSGRNNTIGDYNTFAGFHSGYSNVDGNFNNFYGTGTGFYNENGSNNVFIGPESGYNNIAGSYNTFIGYRAGYTNNANNNVFIGNECGLNNTTGSLNVFIGYAAGYLNTTGSGNVFMGNGAGINNIDGNSNIFLGERSGFTNDSGEKNVYIGYQTGYKATSAYSNVCIGHLSGYELTSAYQNVFIGESAGNKTTWGEGNVFIGNAAGYSNVTGGSNVCIGTGAGQNATASNNTFVGWGTGFDNTNGTLNSFFGLQAGFNNTSGSYNVSIGAYAGYGNESGSGNVFIGRYAGYSESGSNKLYIDNSTTSTPLIYGDFSANKVRINGDLGVGVLPSGYKMEVAGKLNLNSGGLSGVALSVDDAEALWYNGSYFSWGFGGSYNYFADKVTIGNSGSYGYALYVQGSSYATGAWYSSDKKFKKSIEPLDNAVERLLKVEGVSYLWKTDEYSDRNFPEGRHFGVIAQQVEPYFPEIVMDAGNGEKSVAYNELIPVLIEAIKEQQQTIKKQELENEEIKQILMELREEIRTIKSTGSIK
jgi:hypothetical protein